MKIFIGIIQVGKASDIIINNITATGLDVYGTDKYTYIGKFIYSLPKNTDYKTLLENDGVTSIIDIDSISSYKKYIKKLLNILGLNGKMHLYIINV